MTNSLFCGIDDDVFDTFIFKYLSVMFVLMQSCCLIIGFSRCHIFVSRIIHAY
jgi:hypothetical protein